MYFIFWETSKPIQQDFNCKIFKKVRRFNNLPWFGPYQQGGQILF